MNIALNSQKQHVKPKKHLEFEHRLSIQFN